MPYPYCVCVAHVIDGSVPCFKDFFIQLKDNNPPDVEKHLIASSIRSIIFKTYNLI
jgi:hypothetical protein